MRPIYLAAAMILALLALAAQPAAADDAGPLEPTVPLEEVPAKYQAKVKRSLDAFTIREPLDPHDFKADRQIFEFLLDRLPMSSRIVKVMELGRYDISKIGRDAIDIDDGEGALVRLRPVVDKAGQRVFFGRGRLRARNLPEVTGEGIVTVVWRSEEDGTLTVRAQIWFTLDDRFLHLVTKVFRRTLGEVAGGRAGAVVDTAVLVTKAVQQDRQGVYDKMQASKEFSDAELLAYREALLD